MAQDKKNKLFDVARPGKTPASPSGRPLVVSNRPMLKDPMMTDDKTEAKEIAEKDGDDKKISPTKPAKVVPEPADLDKNESKKEESKSDETKKQEAAAEPKAEENGQQSEQELGEETKQADETADSVSESAETADKQLKSSQEVQVKQQEEQAKAEAISKLIEEKKYFVPIGEVTRRRTNRNALIILLVFMLLALIVAYALIDGGIIKTNIKLPFDLIPNR